MGKLTNQIATEAEAKSVGSASIGITTNLCCIKSRAIALNCKVASNYADNQLVMTQAYQIQTIYKPSLELTVNSISKVHCVI